MKRTVEMFCDLTLVGPLQDRPKLRAAILERAGGNWSTDLERSKEVAKIGMMNGDLILFRRRATGGIQEVGLTLWEDEPGYVVPNIAPLEAGQLTVSEYNAVLKDFIEQIARPAAEAVGFAVVTTKAEQDLEDWVSDASARKLRAFSDLANKSTGASHPSDEKRWFDFIISVHRSGKKLDSDRLFRWLESAGEWDEERAHNLAASYETAISLLLQYDETREQ